MKILTFVDTHGSHAIQKRLDEMVKKDKPDVIICAGDMTIFGNEIDLVLMHFNRWKIPTLIVHGNHESESSVRKASSLFEYTHFLHKRTMKINGYTFVGYGGGGFSMRDPGFEQFAKTLPKNQNLVLVTHAPPYGTKLDFIIDSHCGNKSFTEFIKKNQPLLMICGHLHENSGKEDVIQKTRVINPGPHGKIIKI
jgi:uncharacterized protein